MHLHWQLYLLQAESSFFGNNGKTTNPYIISGTEKSIMVQALNSFHKILDGDVKPQLKSSNAAEIEKYVKDNANFNAYIPNIESYHLEGVMCSEYNGQKLAHLIYINNDNDVIYIYQTPCYPVSRRKTLTSLSRFTMK